MIKNFLIAALVVATLEFLSSILADNSIIISSAILCILIGLGINHFKIVNFDNIKEKLTNVFLKIGIALVGIQLSFFEFYAYGKISIFIILINFLIVFIIIKLFSQFSNLKSSLINLLAIGSSVCGITAIMASSTIIKNNKNEIGCAVAVVTLVGTLSVFISPYLAGLIFDQDHIKSGIFLGATIHDTSQVVAAGKIYQNTFNSVDAFNSTISTKLIRNSFLLIIIPLLAFCYPLKKNDNDKTNYSNLLPSFIIFFIFFAVIRSLGDIFIPVNLLGNWEAMINGASIISKYFILLALLGLGLSISITNFKSFGIKPFIVGFCISVILICSTTIYLKLI